MLSKSAGLASFQWLSTSESWLIKENCITWLHWNCICLLVVTLDAFKEWNESAVWSSTELLWEGAVPQFCSTLSYQAAVRVSGLKLFFGNLSTICTYFHNFSALELQNVSPKIKDFNSICQFSFVPFAKQSWFLYISGRLGFLSGKPLWSWKKGVVFCCLCCFAYRFQACLDSK